jgi:hypothetical protein
MKWAGMGDKTPVPLLHTELLDITNESLAMLEVKLSRTRDGIRNYLENVAILY